MGTSFKRTSGFCYHRGRSQETMSEPEGDDDDEFTGMGMLEIYVHHARNIHNICIYANQDVYAKFSLTCSPDDAISTRVVAGGGKNPQFDERLTLDIPSADSVLKCEIWMMSRARNYMEDQLLGFTLVPITSVAAAAEAKQLTQDFTLSSTDLFHSPAGTVQLSLTLHTSSYSSDDLAADSSSNPNTSITSEVVILDHGEFGTIEFPDINIAAQNQQMVSDYFDMATAQTSPCRAPLLQFGALSESLQDYEMAANSSDDNNNIRESDSPDGSIRNSVPFTTSTTTSLSDDRNSADSSDKKNSERTCNNSNVDINNAPDTPTSKCGKSIRDGKEEEEENKITRSKDKEHEMDSVFMSPLGNINLEAEQSAMQQQIVDMYMRSMQQFTDSLAKMKLPMDLDAPKAEDGGGVIQSQETVNNLDQKKKKDGSRVFYGSRAFF